MGARSLELGLLVAAIVLAVFMVLIGTAMLLGQGDDPYQALAAYSRYRPGNSIPDGVVCRWMWEYPGGSNQMCTLSQTPYCQQGYLIARDEVISFFRLSGCDLPAAYLVARYGRYKRATRYRWAVILNWGDMSANLRPIGWFNLKQSVSSIGWWQHRP